MWKMRWATANNRLQPLSDLHKINPSSVFLWPLSALIISKCRGNSEQLDRKRKWVALLFFFLKFLLSVINYINHYTITDVVGCAACTIQGCFTVSLTFVTQTNTQTKLLQDTKKITVYFNVLLHCELKSCGKSPSLQVEIERFHGNDDVQTKPV